MFKVVCAGGAPCAAKIRISDKLTIETINYCLQSVINQTYPDWEMVVVLDPADYNINVDDPRIKIHFNDTMLLSTINTLKAVSMLDTNDDDILVFLDGDDWLFDNAFEVVADKYNNDDVLVTHGSWVSFPPGKMGRQSNNPYTKDDYKNIRGDKWRGSALRTMKYKVFKLIKDEDLKDDKGKYLIAGPDVALMYPALEMAGYGRVKFIKEEIYVYNVTGIRTTHTHREQSRGEYKYLKTKKPYPILPKDF